MLNPYFAFGVPAFLLVLYVAFALFRRSSDIPYLGFALFIIAGFLTGFSLQVIQQAINEVEKTSLEHVQETHLYSPYLLAIPLIVGILLLILNLIRGYLKVKTFVCGQNKSNLPRNTK
jgi:ABC-type polysaccharide transport system permease subunit